MTDEPTYEVTLVSGETVKVLSSVEARWLNTSRDNYLEQTKFTETTDLRDLDRLLILELMVFRWTQWLSQGCDYEGFDIDEALIRRNLREYSDQLNRIKDSMGLNKKARDDAASDGDVNAYLANLKQRAKIFGVHREKQLTKALVLMQELSAVLGSFDRSDAEERAKLGFETEKDIVDWIRSTMLPEFAEIDEHFRTNEQRYWIRNM